MDSPRFEEFLTAIDPAYPIQRLMVRAGMTIKKVSNGLIGAYLDPESSLAISLAKDAVINNVVRIKAIDNFMLFAETEIV